MGIQTAEIFELVSPPIYRLVLAEPAFAHARTVTSTLDAVEEMADKLPAADLVLAAVQRYALLTNNHNLADFVASLDELVNC